MAYYSVPAAAAKSLQSCLTLCDPIDGSPPGSPIPGILQARTLEWIAISFSYRFTIVAFFYQRLSTKLSRRVSQSLHLCAEPKTNSLLRIICLSKCSVSKKKKKRKKERKKVKFMFIMTLNYFHSYKNCIRFAIPSSLLHFISVTPHYLPLNDALYIFPVSAPD